jgi:Zn-dependent alcohol dehydrogenase
VGIGGIGASAILGAKAAGARVVAAIDPVEFKRTKALELGATHAYASIAEARADVADSTWNRGFDVVIMAMSVGNGKALGEASELAGKRGRIVVTNMHPATETSIDLSPIMLTVFERQVVGSLFGSANPRYEIPMLLELYSQGRLDLDALVTRTYPLEGVNEGYDDMRAGRNIRGVLVYGDD